MKKLTSSSMALYFEYASLFILTLLLYGAALWLYRRSKLAILHPLLTSTTLIVILLTTLDISYTTYKTATWAIDALLGPTVVALGWALYRQLEHLKKHYASILTSVVVGAVVSILSMIVILRISGVPNIIEQSLVAKSVTTPIAIQITERLGGIPSIASFVVMIAGIFGSIAGPFILRRVGVTDAIARGLALGSASHGTGTARAMELGAIEGAIGGLAIGLMGLITTLMMPLVEWILW